MKVKFSIQGKFLILIIAIVSLGNVLVGIISLKTANNVIKQSAITLLDNLADKIAVQIYDLNEKEFNVLESIAAMPVMSSNEFSAVKKSAYVKAVAQRNPEKYQNIGYYDKNGIAILDNGTTMDFSTRAYFAESN